MTKKPLDPGLIAAMDAVMKHADRGEALCHVEDMKKLFEDAGSSRGTILFAICMFLEETFSSSRVELKITGSVVKHLSEFLHESLQKLKDDEEKAQ